MSADFEHHRIHIIYGDNPFDMIPTMLDAMDPFTALSHRSTVGIKPNLVVSKSSDSGATTDPRLVEAVIVYLRNLGIQNISIIESAWIGDDTDRAFDACGYRTLKDKWNVRLVNVEKSKTVTRRGGDLDIRVCEEALTLDYLINIPVLKAHSQTRLTCALKNLKGLIPAAEKRRFHELGLDRPIASLNRIIRPRLTLVDGIVGDLSFEEGGNPVRMNRILGGTDPVLVDAYAATLLGYAPEEITHVHLASRMGVGSSDLSTAAIEFLNTPMPGTESCLARPTAEKYLPYIEQQQACSACLGSLLHALQRFEASARLAGLSEQIRIGQGFRHKKGPGIGVGNCTRGLANHVPGCPPSALDIRVFLKSRMSC